MMRTENTRPAVYGNPPVLGIGTVEPGRSHAFLWKEPGAVAGGGRFCVWGGETSDQCPRYLPLPDSILTAPNIRAVFGKLYLYPHAILVYPVAPGKGKRTRRDSRWNTLRSVDARSVPPSQSSVPAS